MRTVLLLAVLAVALVAVGSSSAHSAKVAGIPKPHKLWNDVREWFDPPPGHPDMTCDEERARDPERRVVQVFDPKLGAYVEWECRCPEPGKCAWFRLRIVPDQFAPFWEQQERMRWRREWHRACASIVCKRERVTHRYPALFASGGR